MEKREYSFFNEKIGDMLKDRRGYYLLINAVSKRVRQLQRGERPLVSFPDGSREPVRIAIEELLQEKLEIAPRLMSLNLAIEDATVMEEDDYGDVGLDGDDDDTGVGEEDDDEL